MDTVIFLKGGVMQKLIVKQIIQIETCLQCLSLSRYVFYLQFKAFPKQSDNFTRNSHYFCDPCYFFAHNCIFSSLPGLSLEFHPTAMQLTL